MPQFITINTTEKLYFPPSELSLLKEKKTEKPKTPLKSQKTEPEKPIATPVETPKKKPAINKGLIALFKSAFSKFPIKGKNPEKDIAKLLTK